MRVVVGPVTRSSARAWLAYARRVVDDLEELAPDAMFSSPEVVATFTDYLDQWSVAAATSGEFLWEADIPAEHVEFHMHAFHQVATMLSDREEQLGGPQAPEEGEEFYLALLHGVLTALEAESHASAEFAQHLGRFWPGQEMAIR